MEYFHPAIGDDIEELFQPRTRMICLEAPASVTMEMHDTAAIARVARRHGVTTMMDNTWAGPLGFRPLAHGVDLSIEAATKYMGGHSDLLMGSISMNEEEHYERLRETQSALGHYVSPDDCFLVMRGLETMQLRQEAQSAAALRIARWLERQPEVQEMLYPPLPSDPGHALVAAGFHDQRMPVLDGARAGARIRLSRLLRDTAALRHRRQLGWRAQPGGLLPCGVAGQPTVPAHRPAR